MKLLLPSRSLESRLSPSRICASPVSRLLVGDVKEVLRRVRTCCEKQRSRAGGAESCRLAGRRNAPRVSSERSFSSTDLIPRPTLPDPETLKPLERIEGLNFTAEELAKLSKDRAERRASVCAVPLALAHSTRAHALAKQLAIPCLDSRRAAEQAHDFLLLVGPKLSLQVVTKPPLEQKAGPVFAGPFAS